MIFNESSFSKSESSIGYRGIEMTLGVVSDPDSELRLALNAKRGKTFNYQFTDCLKKHDFLQTNSNIDILYSVGKHFLP